MRTLLLSLLITLPLAAHATDEGQAPAAQPPTPPELVAAAAEPPQPQLIVEELAAGVGSRVAESGMLAVVHYTGWLFDAAAPDQRGRKFDSSLDRNRPFVFPLGAGRVIRGWDQGVAGMQVGARRRLIIPPELGYGDRNLGNGLIPPNSTLLFEVELLGLETVTNEPVTE